MPNKCQIIPEICLTDNPAPSYLAVAELLPIQQALDGRAVNTKLRRDLVDGKVLFYRLRGLRLLLHLLTVLIGEIINEPLSLSTCVQRAKDILAGDLRQLFAGFLLGSSQACHCLSSS